MLSFHNERMSAEFEKFHIEGLPFPAVIHHFSDVDKGGAHDHPFAFTTHILRGSYVEKIYIIENGQWHCYPQLREVGSVHEVAATCIHEIIALPDGDCYTLIVPKEKEREPGFWQFNDDGIFFRQWNETEFKRVEP